MWQEIIVSIYWGSCAVGLRAAKMCQPELFNSSMVYWINGRMRNTVKGNLGPRERLSANATGLDNPGLQLETVFHKAVPPTVIHVRQTHKTGFRLPTGSAWSGHSNPQPERGAIPNSELPARLHLWVPHSDAADTKLFAALCRPLVTAWASCMIRSFPLWHRSGCIGHRHLLFTVTSLNSLHMRVSVCR